MSRVMSGILKVHSIFLRVQNRRLKMILEVTDVTCDVHVAYRFLDLRKQNHNEFLFEAKSREEFN